MTVTHFYFLIFNWINNNPKIRSVWKKDLAQHKAILSCGNCGSKDVVSLLWTKNNYLIRTRWLDAFKFLWLRRRLHGFMTETFPRYKYLIFDNWVPLSISTCLNTEQYDTSLDNSVSSSFRDAGTHSSTKQHNHEADTADWSRESGLGLGSQRRWKLSQTVKLLIS